MVRMIISGLTFRQFLKSSNPRFFRVRHIGEWRKQNAKTQPAQVRIEFFEIVDGNFINITEN